MNARLKANALRPHRAAIGNLIESMDYFDATNSREAMPSHRMRHRKTNWFAFAGWGLVAFVAMVVLAAFSL
ncbi:hypothetical protein [Novilysobacter erysipheiresistens]|uniref:Uncharacterized protein n=1 Tax=Novilysobacter erysipheiresistens TaxID=1749332 RepID=A0ABU7YUQ7_9GAMM